jgi:hypothetical protein
MSHLVSFRSLVCCIFVFLPCFYVSQKRINHEMKLETKTHAPYDLQVPQRAFTIQSILVRECVQSGNANYINIVTSTRLFGEFEMKNVRHLATETFRRRVQHGNP